MDKKNQVINEKNKSLVVKKADKTFQTAFLEDGKLIEFLVEDEESGSLVGNVYLGIVKNIMPNQISFIDIGLSEPAFIYLKDNKESMFYENGKLKLKQGDSVLVQVTRDKTENKQISVTSSLEFGGESLLISSRRENPRFSVSKKINSKSEKERLLGIAQKHFPKNIDIIFRTSSEGQSEEALINEFQRLYSFCKNADEHWIYEKPPTLLFKQEDFSFRGISPFVNIADEIIVDDIGYLEDLKRWIEGKSNAEIRLIGKGKDDLNFDIFKECFDIDKQIEKALNRKVWLRSGGFIIIEPTEALVVIDVNSGKFEGKKNHEKSILMLNIEAAKEIMLQLRLRNVGGIVIIDFITMIDKAHVAELLQVLKEEARKDRIAVDIAGITNLGLVEITRKKTRKPLWETIK